MPGTVFQRAELNHSQRVAEDGKVLLLELGWVMAHAKERAACEDELRKAYSNIYQQNELYVQRTARAGEPR